MTSCFSVAGESTSDAGPSSMEESERKTESSSSIAAQPQMEDSAENATQHQCCLCPCCTFSGPPSQPADIKRSKQVYKHASKVLK